MSSAWVKKYPGQSRVGLLFTAGGKYVRVGSGPFSSSNQAENILYDKLCLMLNFEDIGAKFSGWL